MMYLSLTKHYFIDHVFRLISMAASLNTRIRSTNRIFSLFSFCHLKSEHYLVILVGRILKFILDTVEWTYQFTWVSEV